MQLVKVLAATLFLTVPVGLTAAAQAPAFSSSQKMAATVLQQWPVSTHDQWAYEEGTLLDGIAAD